MHQLNFGLWILRLLYERARPKEKIVFDICYMLLKGFSVPNLIKKLKEPKKHPKRVPKPHKKLPKLSKSFVNVNMFFGAGCVELFKEINGVLLSPLKEH